MSKEIEPPFDSHDVVIVSDGPDGHVWHCYTCDKAGWYDAGTDTGAHGQTADE